MKRPALVLAACIAVVVPGPAARAGIVPTVCTPLADFDANGKTDLAIGVPLEDIGSSLLDAGGVNVLYGADAGSGLSGTDSQFWGQNSSGVDGTAESEDSMGVALASGDFDGDTFSDLAIGVPFEDASGVADLGAVHVLYGSAAGLTATGDQLLRLTGADLEPGEESPQLGFALAAGDFDGDAFTDLAIGIPGRFVDGVPASGEVRVHYGSGTGLDTSPQVWNQDTAGVPGDGEPGDSFGNALAAGDFNTDGECDLAIGAPIEGFAGKVAAGAVTVLPGSTPEGLTATGAQLWRQGYDGVAGNAEAGDLFGLLLASGEFDGDGFADLAVGVPFEAIGATTAGGLVHAIYGSGGGLQTADDQLWTQDSAGITGSVETGDLFGSTLASGDFDDDGFADLAVGVFGEDLSGVDDAGAVHAIYGSTGVGLSSAGEQFWSQDAAGVLEEAEDGESFGAALGVGDFDADGASDLAIGVPLEDAVTEFDGGAVNVLYGVVTTGLGASDDQVWHQDSAGVVGSVEIGDTLGSALTG